MKTVKLSVGGHEYSLSEGVSTLGRAPDNTIVLEDESISSHHAEIEFGDDGCVLRDLESTNGTLLNGIRIEKTPLKAGDSVCFGSLSATVAITSINKETISPPSTSGSVQSSSEARPTNSLPPPLPHGAKRLQPLSIKTLSFWWPRSAWGQGTLTFALSLSFLLIVWESRFAAIFVTEFLYLVITGIRYLLSHVRRVVTPSSVATRPIWRRPAVIGIGLACMFLLGIRTLDALFGDLAGRATLAALSRSTTPSATTTVALDLPGIINRDLLSSLGTGSEPKQITYSQLWADTETYFNRPFVFHGRVRTPRTPAYLPGDAEIYKSDNYRELVLVSLDPSRDDTEDIILCFAQKGMVEPLIALLSKDESKSYTGYFMLYIPRQFKYVNLYKSTGIFGAQREIKCELIGFAPESAFSAQK